MNPSVLPWGTEKDHYPPTPLNPWWPDRLKEEGTRGRIFPFHMKTDVSSLSIGGRVFVPGRTAEDGRGQCGGKKLNI